MKPNRYKYTTDESLPNSSIICWSLRSNGKVPVQCGKCGKERWLYVQNATAQRFTGLCYQCGQIASRKHTNVEILDTGSIVYWNERHALGRDQKVPVECGICGEIRHIAAHKIPHTNFTGYCVDCARTGQRSHFWKGGRFKHPNGYILVRLTPEHTFYSMADSHHLVPEHRLVMAQCVGRCLRDDEIVHHKNGIKDDNRIENLELLDRHLHHTGYKSPQQDDINLEVVFWRAIIDLLNTVIKSRKRNK
jgi:hypothetical protein